MLNCSSLSETTGIWCATTPWISDYISVNWMLVGSFKKVSLERVWVVITEGAQMHHSLYACCCLQFSPQLPQPSVGPTSLRGRTKELSPWLGQALSKVKERTHVRSQGGCGRSHHGCHRFPGAGGVREAVSSGLQHPECSTCLWRGGWASKRTILVNSNFSSKALPLRLLFLSGTYQRKLIPYSFLHDTLSNIWRRLYLL